MTKRDLFSELSEGFDALASARAGKRTLRTHEVELKPEVTITSAELKSIREHLNLSRQLPENENQNLGKLGARQGSAQCASRIADPAG